uniref:TIP41-like protein n=1 Tax=Ixodes ricinus TaxID=34613 RepID=A0A0K8RAD8_IXORI
MCGGREEHFTFGPWEVTGRSSHILQSQCPTPSVCNAAPSDGTGETNKSCVFCRYVEELKLPTHPDMTFASNLLRLEHADGYGIEFTCMDALRCLSSENYVPKVAAAQAWREARPLADYPKGTNQTGQPLRIGRTQQITRAPCLPRTRVSLYLRHRSA